MNKEDLITAQRDLIKILETQVVDLSMMSKIELGDDVIAEINKLRFLIHQLEEK